MECNKCGKKGHVGPDCRSSNGKERKQPRNRSKNTGNRAKSILASSLKTVDEAVDDDTYDEDQSGFLYIDKSDIMPELISDDDTDSKDESPLDQGMNKLSIVPVNLHTFDSKKFSYGTDSAELDRFLDEPHPTIVYSTHIPRWSDTRDAQDSDMLQQFISSQQGRIHDRLLEHIIIDPS